MSEEILRALMQLFAIIAKQDEGISTKQQEYVQTFLKEQLNEKAVNEYLEMFDTHLNEKKKKSRLGGDEQVEKEANLTSVTDSVRILGICKKINKTLTQKQKVVVLVRLFELVNSDMNFSDNRIMIIDTAAKVFNITKEEYKEIESFVIKTASEDLAYASMMIINDGEAAIAEECKHILSDKLDGKIIILKIASADLYFLRYTGESELFLNGKVINNRRIYLFANGSIIKLPKGKPVFYSDVVAKFLADEAFANISFEVKHLEFKFPNGNIGLRDISFTETSGKLIGIMGASGAGKTTMLNVLSGIEIPSGGEVLINQINLHKENEKIKGLIGYIPQDDLLIEELTVFENLYYNAKLCFNNKTEEELTNAVTKTLENLGLEKAKNLKVGNPLEKTISGGQRKRLNIALELIREPAVLFVDEPTSGLSSRDSENVMELLRELTLKGKLIFVVIHQPSSDIYKMFDNIMFLDTGGYLAYYGNPVEAVMYFKDADCQINSEQGECGTCGNVNPEAVFNIIESKIVDEYGKSSNLRKKEPTEWADLFSKKRIDQQYQIYSESPENKLSIPNWLNQFKIFFTRDLLSKLSNTQYLVINFLEAPLLAFLLAFVIRYKANAEANLYIFKDNQNIYPYIFMAIIVALFIGLTVSAEEIFKDRKILKREKFLNLSKSSYLFSKIGILFILSAIQAITFVLIGNMILDIKGMWFEYWLLMFTIACSANVLGLNISATFNSAVTIYILIPLLIIPQMMLCGAMFNFDKLNKSIGGGGNNPPIIAEIMPSRWAFEALIVKQFKDNKYEKRFYKYDKSMSGCDYKSASYIPYLNTILDTYISKAREAHLNGRVFEISKDDKQLLYNEISHELRKGLSRKEITFERIKELKTTTFNEQMADDIKTYLVQLSSFYNDRYNVISELRDQKTASMQATPEKAARYKRIYESYYNDNINDVLLNRTEKNKVMRLNNHLYQKVDPIYLDPEKGFRAHFYAPTKRVFGKLYDTFYVNIIVIWIFTMLLYLSLYFDGLKRLLDLFGNLSSLIKAIFLSKKPKKKIEETVVEPLIVETTAPAE